MGFINKKKISWDTQLINELVKISGLNEKSLKNNIQMLCVIMVFKGKKGKKRHH